MSTIQNVQPILVGLMKLQEIAGQRENVACNEWLAFSQSLSNEAQWGSANVDKLNALKYAYDLAGQVTGHVIAYHALLFGWAINDDARAGHGLFRYPIPIPTADVTSLAVANGVDLSYKPVDPPAPAFNVQWVLMVPGGYLAVISPSTGVDSRTGKNVYDALRGDNVPDGTVINTPGDPSIKLQRHFVHLPFGDENWYTAVN